jgi:hypothetical protein
MPLIPAINRSERNKMTQFDDRKNGFEQKFAQDQKMSFALEARTAKLFGIWAAQKLGLSGEQADIYAKNLIAANLDEAGFEDILRPVRSDFSQKNLPVSESEIQSALTKAMDEARLQIAESQS